MTSEERSNDSNDGVSSWSCPECAFTFDAAHTDTDGGGHSCPVCAEADLEQRLAAVERERDEAESKLFQAGLALANEQLRSDRAESALAAALARIAAVEATVAAWPDGNERMSDYAAARGQCKRAMLAVLAAPPTPTGPEPAPDLMKALRASFDAAKAEAKARRLGPATPEPTEETP